LRHFSEEIDLTDQICVRIEPMRWRWSGKCARGDLMVELREELKTHSAQIALGVISYLNGKSF